MRCIAHFTWKKAERKISQGKRKAQTNLENCRYLDCGRLPPPLTAHKRNESLK